MAGLQKDHGWLGESSMGWWNIWELKLLHNRFRQATANHLPKLLLHRGQVVPTSGCKEVQGRWKRREACDIPSSSAAVPKIHEGRRALLSSRDRGQNPLTNQTFLEKKTKPQTKQSQQILQTCIENSLTDCMISMPRKTYNGNSYCIWSVFHQPYSISVPPKGC